MDTFSSGESTTFSDFDSVLETGKFFSLKKLTHGQLSLNKQSIFL